MAIARKGIELDFDTLTPMYLLGTAAITLARASPTGCFGKAIFPPNGVIDRPEMVVGSAGG